ncbi:hypothetical protein [Salinisphaera sp. T31B1]|uniref:hypothetical protein n=1 Tax=Salinisphaera sp. T31B1 TaxID=727963 RepID=UPI00333F6518
MKSTRLWMPALTAGLLMAAAVSVPALAADSDNSMGKDKASATGSEMPATKAQAEQLREVPDDQAGGMTGEQGAKAGGMPATKAQKEQLKETDKMSGDESESSDSKK